MTETSRPSGAPRDDARVLGDLDPTDVRVRFPPSPTGNLHVGNVRSALFNWVLARHYGGTFVLRLEDTDAERSTQESYENVLDSLRWLGLDWDEGPEVGGPFAPYRQSERYDLYRSVVERLVEGGFAYHDHYTKAELDALGDDARHRDPARPCPTLPDAEIARREAAGEYAVRMHVPEGEIAFDDLVRGHVSFHSDNVGDFVIVRANGDPLYTLVNPVDDALMRITHVLRGEDLLSSTPRQIVMYRALAALGVAEGPMPRFGHLPIVMGEGNKRLSKRDAGSGLAEYRTAGYLPEGLLNYLALLGWGIADDHDVFTLQEMVEAFDILRVNANPARFDPKKAASINAEHVRRLGVDELTPLLVPFLAEAGLVADPPTAEQEAVLEQAVPLVSERMSNLSESVGLLAFLFTPDDDLVIDEAAALDATAAPVLDAAASALAEVEDWTTESIEAALRAALVDGLGLKPRHAFGPVRVAISGRKVSPPLFESMEILGRDSSLARLAHARATTGA